MAKLNASQIAEELSKVGMTYISGTYKNLDSLLNCECEHGHEYMLSIKKARKGFECPSCIELENALENEKTHDILKAKRKKRILGLDQSSTIIGYAVIEGDELITFGVHEETNSDIIHRAMKHKQWLKGILGLWEIDEVVFEDIYMGNNTKTAISLAQVLGALQIAVYEQLGNKPIVVPAVTWKSHCNIKGKNRQTQKENTQKFIKQKFNINASFDCADAICIALYGHYIHSFGNEVRFDD